MIIIGRNQLRLNTGTMKAIIQDYLERQTYADKPNVTDVTVVVDDGDRWFVVELDGTVEKPPRGVG